MAATFRIMAMAVIGVVTVGGLGLALRGGTAPKGQVEGRPAMAATRAIYGLGSVEAKTISPLGFELAGTLIELTADHGDRVARGQVLARLDARQQQAQVAQAEAGLRQAQAALVQAQARLDRARAVLSQRRNVNTRRQTLARNGTVSIEAAEDAQSTADVAIADVAVAASDVEAARGGVESAHARVQLDRAALAKYTLIAPYDGLVAERSRDLGTTMTAGASLLTVVDPATIWVRAYVDEALAGPLAVGQRADITLRSLPGRTFAGRVARVDIETDRVSEERRIHVAFDAVPAEFHLGEQAEVLIDVASLQADARR